jgi:5'-3' exonuclease
MAKFLLIDTFNVLMRASHVTRGDAYEKAGLSMMITINSIKSAWQRFGADHAVFCLEGRSWRRDVYPHYKANRAVQKMGRSQTVIEEEQVFMDAANDFMNFVKEHTNATVLKHSRCEADDFIARWIQIFSEQPEHEFIIVSSDSDFVQLLAPNVKIYDGVNKKIYTADGVFDEKMQPYRDKKGNAVEAINPEYVLFEKCIRGDTSDNVPSAYPGVRAKGSAKKAGIDDAFADRHAQGYTWVNFMRTKWEDHEGKQHIVEDDYKRNVELIDLTKQPEEIKNVLDHTIIETLSEPKNVKQIGIQFLKFCARHELTKLAENPDKIVEIFTSKFEQ